MYDGAAADDDERSCYVDRRDWPHAATKLELHIAPRGGGPMGAPSKPVIVKRLGEARGLQGCSTNVWLAFRFACACACSPAAHQVKSS